MLSAPDDCRPLHKMEGGWGVGGRGREEGGGGAAERESVRTEVGGEVSSRYVIAYCGLNQRRMFVFFTF